MPSPDKAYMCDTLNLWIRGYIFSVVLDIVLIPFLMRMRKKESPDLATLGASRSATAH